MKATVAERRTARARIRRAFHLAKASEPVEIDPLHRTLARVLLPRIRRWHLVLGVALDPAVVENRVAACLACVTACTPAVQVGIVRLWRDAIATSFRRGRPVAACPACGRARSDRLEHMLQCSVAVPTVARVGRLFHAVGAIIALGAWAPHRAGRTRKGIAAPPEHVVLGVMTAEAFVRAARAAEGGTRAGGAMRFKSAVRDIVRRHGA